MVPDQATEMVIPLSKNKLALVLLGSVAFVGGSGWIWVIAEKQADFHSLFLKAVALAGAFFFGLCAIYALIKLFDSRPGLIIDEHGIVDHSSAVAAGRLAWDEITGLKVAEIWGQRFLTIEVVDPRKYLDRVGFLKRMLNAANMKITGSPVNIASNALRIDFDDLVRALTAALTMYKRDGQIVP